MLFVFVLVVFVLVAVFYYLLFFIICFLFVVFLLFVLVVAFVVVICCLFFHLPFCGHCNVLVILSCLMLMFIHIVNIKLCPIIEIFKGEMILVVSELVKC